MSLPMLSAVGNLAADSELNYASDGTPVCNFTVYCNGRVAGDDKHVERVRCAVWGKGAEVASQYLKKGMPVFVNGEAITEVYLSKQQNKHLANFRINRATFGLINTGNRGNDTAAAQTFTGAAVVTPDNDAAEEGDPMANGLAAVQPPF